MVVKIYEKVPQTLSEVIRLAEKLNAAQQLRAMLTPTMVKDMGDISTNHNHSAIPTAITVAVSEGKHHTLHLATAAAYAALWLMDAPSQFMP